MAQENLETFSTEKLIKRKKFASFLIGLLIGIFIVSLVLLGISIVQEKESAFLGLIPGFASLFIIFPLSIGVKKINEELKKREEA